MKTVESSAVQPKQWAEKGSREDNRKQDNPDLCPSGVKSNIVRGSLIIHRLCPVSCPFVRAGANGGPRQRGESQTADDHSTDGVGMR